MLNNKSVKTMEVKKKYELTSETIKFNGVTLHRIKALKDFSDVKEGDLGGWIEKEENLSQMGNAWVYSNAKVYGNAKVFGDAQVFCDAEVYGNAQVYGNAEVYGYALVYDNAEIYHNAKVFGNAEICGNAEVFGNAKICGNAVVKNNEDYIVFKNFWSSGRYFTWTRSNNMWTVGCFYGTSKELIGKAYKDSEKSWKEYERVVRYVDSILADE